VKLNLQNAAAVRRAFSEIHASVKAATEASKVNGVEQARGRHAANRMHSSDASDRPAFLGVSVQPMVQTSGYELILGSSIDPQFGPVLLFGAGGQLVEVFKDRALALPPLNATLARRMMERTHIYEALKGVRGRKPVDLGALDQLLVRFSDVVTEHPSIAEIDINPLLASPKGLLALDARVIVHGSHVREEDLPKPAIRPYPTQYLSKWKLNDGTAVTLRPIRPEDEMAIARFHGTLSEQSVYFRYFSQLKLPQRVAHERLMRICFNDYDREIALVADHRDRKLGQHEILGVGRLTKVNRTNDGEFALLISDEWQQLGLGTHLLKSLINIGRQEKLDHLVGYILPENHYMQKVCAKLGFEIHRDAEAGECKATFNL
jgi:acetyltransferase